MPYGIYIHYPYCVHKCSYCDFYSLEDHSTEDKYAELITKEIALRCRGRIEDADTIFFGGGTPSLMKPSLLGNILEELSKHFNISKESEITLECNPGTIDIKYFQEFKQLGVNRISFGVQSFNENELTFLERIHSKEEVFKAFDIARNVGFDNISLDLIFAIPGQTIETWEDTLNKAISLNPNHISTYSLIYEEGTPLHRQLMNRKFESKSEDDDISFYELANKTYLEAGYTQYEVSNYSKTGFECKHNLKYWDSQEYFAFGPSAHGYLDGYRYANYRSIGKYINNLNLNKLPVMTNEIVSPLEKMYERLYLELRAQGLDFNRFNKDFGIDIYSISTQLISELISRKYAQLANGKFKLSSSGYFLGDSVTLKFINVLDNYLEKQEN